MMKRLTWFVAGTITGAVGSGYAKRRVRAAAAQLTPRNVARSGAVALRRHAGDVVGTVRNVRNGRAVRSDAPRSLADRVGADELVLVDGRPVDRHRIVVTRQRS